MSPNDDLDNIEIPEIESAVSNIKKGDELAKLGERELAAGKYQKAISQLKNVQQDRDGQICKIASKLLHCAYRHGQKLINEEPVPDGKYMDKILENVEVREKSSRESPDMEINGDQEKTKTRYQEVRERILEGDRLRKADKYDAAIECYEEAKAIIDQRPASSSGKTLKTEINMNLRKARDKKQPEVSDYLKQKRREIRGEISEGDRLRKTDEYDAAIECYEEAKGIIDQQLAGSNGKGFKRDIDMKLEKTRERKREAVRRRQKLENKVEKLDQGIQELDHNLLARHGFELPYHQATTDVDTVDEPPAVVYIPPLRLDVIEEITAYYNEIKSFEQQLASVAAETGQPTAVTELLGDILLERHPGAEMDPRGERNVVGASENILEGYLLLLEKGDDEGISELETRIKEVHSDIGVDGAEVDSEELSSRLNDIRSWTGQRVRRVELQSRASDLRDRWPPTVEEQVNLDVDVIEQLTGSKSGKPSLSQFESGLETAEQTVSLATEVETVRKKYRTPVIDRLPGAFGQYLHAGGISGTRLNILEETLDVIEITLDAHQQYPSYPFDQVVEQIFAELKRDEFNQETNELIKLVESATVVLDFLDRVDTGHPSVRSDEWRESVRTGLENVSPDTVQQLASLTERMGETLWEQHHLYQFTHEEFEPLVASVFNSKGYETRVTPKVNDEGVDIWARNKGDSVAIEVKQWSENVGRPVVQKLSSHLAKDEADWAIVVTSSDFTKLAKQEADDFGQEMQLINGEELVQMLTESDIPPPVSE